MSSLRRLVLIFTIILTNSWISFAQNQLPRWFTIAFKQQKLGSQYELLGKISPRYLKADFNGDLVDDLVVMVKHKQNKKIGLLLMQGGRCKIVTFGAGSMLGKTGFDETDDLKWIDGWKLYKSKIAYETKFDNGDIIGSIKRKLSHPAISVWQNMDGSPLAGGLIVWNAKQYIWIHQGE